MGIPTPEQAMAIIERIEAGEDLHYGKAIEDGRCDFNDGTPIGACPYPEGSMRRMIYQLSWMQQRGWAERTRYLRRKENAAYEAAHRT
jgi:hypothetical protein